MGRCLSSTPSLEKQRRKALYLRRIRQEEVLKAAGVHVRDGTLHSKHMDAGKSTAEIKKVLAWTPALCINNGLMFNKH